MNSNEPAEKVSAETGSSSTTETCTAEQVSTETDRSSTTEIGTAEQVPTEMDGSSATETGTADQVPTETDGSSAIESGNSSPWNSISFSELYLKRYLRLKTLPLNFSCNACPSKINKVASKQCSNFYIFTCKSLLDRRQLLFNKNHQNHLNCCTFLKISYINVPSFYRLWLICHCFKRCQSKSEAV